MKISLNEIKKYVSIPESMTTADLIQLIGSRLVEVEGSIDLAPKYRHIYIVRVIDCEPIPDTHLHLCQIDTGAAAAQHKQPNGFVQVVCGAPNVHKGMLAVWLAPGAIVPQTYGQEDFKLDVRKLRGYKSYGMLAGLDELDLGDDHSGIVEIDPSQRIPDSSCQEQSRLVQAGDSFAEVFELNDIILDIENKSLTHRPDTFGIIGFAREVAGILGQPFAEPDSLFHPQLKPAPRNLTIHIPDSTLCPRYSCAVIEMSENATATDKYLTPATVFLAKAGMRSISRIVDTTNILMLQTGQPLHAFDYDKFIAVGGASDAIIGVRTAGSGETLQLLDGKTITCSPNDILITSNDHPVALAGAMGGASTEIDASTKRIILESASFSLYHLRKTQMQHGIFSEAITRFTKGQSPEQTFVVLAEAVEYLGGTVVAVADEYVAPVKPSVVKLTTFDINSLLGTDYSQEQITNTLANVGFDVRVSGTDTDNVTLQKYAMLTVTAPYWRTDIHIKEDITEEIGRLLGFDNIPRTLPLRPFIGATPNQLLSLKSELRNILSDQLSAHEVLTYSFVHQDLQSKVGEDPQDSYQIVNSISPELQCFRQSLVPSLLLKMHDNLRTGYHDFALYELNQVTRRSLGYTDERVPLMQNHLGFTMTGDYYAVKAQILSLLQSLHIDAQLIPFDSKIGAPYYEPLHSAMLCVQLPRQKSLVLAQFGEIRHGICSKLKINQPMAAFELDLDILLQTPRRITQNLQLSKFPPVERDLTVKTPSSVLYQDIYSALTRVLDAQNYIIYDIIPTSVYQASGVADSYNYSFHLTFSNTKKTLENTEISAIMKDIEQQLRPLGAEIV